MTINLSMSSYKGDNGVIVPLLSVPNGQLLHNKVASHNLKLSTEKMLSLFILYTFKN